MWIPTKLMVCAVSPDWVHVLVRPASATELRMLMKFGGRWRIGRVVSARRLRVVAARIGTGTAFEGVWWRTEITLITIWVHAPLPIIVVLYTLMTLLEPSTSPIKRISRLRRRCDLLIESGLLMATSPIIHHLDLLLAQKFAGIVGEFAIVGAAIIAKNDGASIGFLSVHNLLSQLLPLQVLACRVGGVPIATELRLVLAIFVVQLSVLRYKITSRRIWLIIFTKLFACSLLVEHIFRSEVLILFRIAATASSIMEHITA